MKMIDRNQGISRRAFVKTVGYAAMAPLALHSKSFAGDANGKLDIAYIGMGNRIQGHVKQLVGMGHNAVAFCDCDLPRAEAARSQYSGNASVYQDYRKLFDKEQSVDAVLISTPDHWHAPIIRHALQAGKHIFCEKPLTHSVAEAREMRELSRASKMVTQMGNQGSASSNLRRSIELIQSGLLGQVTDIYVWHSPHAWVGDTPGIDRGDPIPAGLNWNLWCGPSRLRPYKEGLYHPFKWRNWFDYGNGFLGDFCCHAFNMPMRALGLEYPERIEIDADNLGREAVPVDAVVTYRFPARGNLSPTTIHVCDGGRQPEGGILSELVPTFGSIPRHGCLLKGEKGLLSAGLWNSECYIKLNGEERFSGAGNHELAKQIPQRLPRVGSHLNEWVDAILDGGKTYSDFDIGGHLTEIGLAGIVALRMGENIEWDGENMKVPGHPDADCHISPAYRQKWL